MPGHKASGLLRNLPGVDGESVGCSNSIPFVHHDPVAVVLINDAEIFKGHKTIETAFQESTEAIGFI